MIKFVLFFIQLCIFNNLFIKFYIQGYYSLRRYFKSSKVFLKSVKYWIYFLGVFITFFLSFFNNLSVYFLIILNIYLYIVIIKTRLNYKRRGIFLYTLSLFLTSLLLFVDRFEFFIIIANFLMVPFANIMLLPLEKSIQNKYIKMAKNKLNSINPLVIGITGSFGKTTFKEYLYALLKNKYSVYKSKGNYNTLMGLTKYINQELSEDCEVLILEMGIDENHGIRKYHQLVSLDIAVIVGVGKVHLSTFKTYQNIINSKCEIETLLKDDGVLFINGEYDELKNHHFEKKTICYNIDDNLNDKLTLFQKMAVSGVYKIGTYLNVEKRYFTYFLNNLPPVKRRFEIKKTDDALIINDSYNINENALKESIKYLANLNGIKIIITGGLVELGKEYYQTNYNIGLEMQNIDYLFLITTNKKHPLAKGFLKTNNTIYFFKNLKQCEQKLKEIQGYKIILISAKGSDYFLQ